MKDCGAYGQVDQRYQLPPTKPQNVDSMGVYEPVGGNDDVYENVRGESQTSKMSFTSPYIMHIVYIFMLPFFCQGLKSLHPLLESASTPIIVP